MGRALEVTRGSRMKGYFSKVVISKPCDFNRRQTSLSPSQGRPLRLAPIKGKCLNKPAQAASSLIAERTLSAISGVTSLT